MRLKYRKNDADIEGSEIVKYLPKGKHFVTFVYYLKEEANSWNKFEVVANTEYFESTDRVNTAEIDALKTFASSGTLPAAAIDTTVPTATIEQQTIKAVLFGQGLATAETEWDGRISITEEVPRFNIGFTISKFSEAVATEFEDQTHIEKTFEETTSKYNIGLSFKVFTADLQTTES